MIMYYNRRGEPITSTLAWDELFSDPKYKIVKQDFTPNKKYWVSTVWLGIDHSFTWFEDKPNPHPLIFETMVFNGNKKSFDEQDMERYSTETQALAGHNKMLKKWSKKELK